ncbi:hypothetical protein FIBSPDRAFT_1038690 [Athelia psychrophila]|uniref:Uncharacterized protein n=1 Tax=Athelia psychrophila TaxID=1759441 RepID=A0A166SN90_9AGAM|nr:hypothetical protein FIBSPDRAFT_1038690 [Fibularhizoctonia sp. CBS 109695]
MRVYMSELASSPGTAMPGHMIYTRTVHPTAALIAPPSAERPPQAHDKICLRLLHCAERRCTSIRIRPETDMRRAGSTGSSGQDIVSKTTAYLVTDSRYRIEA